jgi:preprotein translocase subunit SecE
MADNDANNKAAGATGSPKGGAAQVISGIEGNASTGQPPIQRDQDQHQSDAATIPDWAIWLAIGFAVFIWMWRTGKIAGIRNYILETKEQLDKCTWPTWNELRQHIVVVLISSFLLAVFTVAADFVVREIVWGALMDSKTVLFNTKDL